MNQDTPTVLTITSVPFDENSYLVYFESRNDCLVVDPGLEPDKIVAEIEDRQLELAAILCTHGHADHIAGNQFLKDRWPAAPLIIGAGDANKLTDAAANLSAGFGIGLTSPAADRTVAEGDTLDLAGLHLEVREAPGHSTGHVVFVASRLNPMQVFGGDVLFASSVGRTDLPGCSFEVLHQSIHEKLYSLADDTIVLPGHGPPTTIGAEKRTNPFVKVGGTGSASVW